MLFSVIPVVFPLLFPPLGQFVIKQARTKDSTTTKKIVKNKIYLAMATSDALLFFLHCRLLPLYPLHSTFFYASLVKSSFEFQLLFKKD